MNKIVFKLKDIISKMNLNELGFAFGSGPITLSATNLDDVFGVIGKRGIREVEVDFDEMHLITMFTLANIRQYNDENETNWDAFKLIQEGKMDKFLGVKLKFIQ